MPTRSLQLRAAGLLLVAVAACTLPGPRAEGRGVAEWSTSPPTSWSGPCVYTVHTRWASNLPHELRLRGDDTELWAMISSRRAYRPGSSELQSTGLGDLQGLVLDGGTVVGSLMGPLEVVQVGDSTFVSLDGRTERIDTIPFRMTCRLGPVREGGS